MTETIKIKRYNSNGFTEQEDPVVQEHRLNLYVNDKPYISLMCLPQHLTELTVGFLYSEKLIRSYTDVTDIKLTGTDSVYISLENTSVNTSKRKALPERVLTSGFAHGSVSPHFYEIEDLPKIAKPLKVSSEETIKLMACFNKQSELFQKTGAVHSSSLISGKVKLFYEDIGRHNAVDKAIGSALISGIPINGGILLTSGRISSEILIKAARPGIRAIISTSAPTKLAVDIAKSINMTLIGFARGNRFNIYSG